MQLFCFAPLTGGPWRAYSGVMALPTRKDTAAMTDLLKRMPKYFVVDCFASSEAKALISGPFSTAEKAETDRREWNCADDYVIVDERGEIVWTHAA